MYAGITLHVHVAADEAQRVEIFSASPEMLVSSDIMLASMAHTESPPLPSS